MKKLVSLVMVVALVAVSQATIIPGNLVLEDTLAGGTFTGPYGPWPTQSDAYTDGAYDWNPGDPLQWGLTLDVSINSLPGDGQDGEAGVLHFGDFNFGGVIIETWSNQYVVQLAGHSFNQSGLAPTVGGTDHLELTYIDGLWTLEVNGTAVTLQDFGSGFAFDPSARVTIGGMNHNIDSGGNGIVRGIDATIGDIALYSVPEPATMALLGLGGLGLLRRKRN